MPNADRPSGLSPVRYLNGSPWNGAGNIYHIDSTDGNAFAIGDPVASSGTAHSNGIASVTIGVAGSPLRGVIVAIGSVAGESAYIDPTDLTLRVLPATKTKDYYVLVVDDPNVIFEVQEVSGGTALAAAQVGLNANLVAGANNGYVSGWELNNAGEAVTATLNVRLLGLVQRSDNAFGEHAKWLVLINDHELRVGSLGL